MDDAGDEADHGRCADLLRKHRHGLDTGFVLAEKDYFWRELVRKLMAKVEMGFYILLLLKLT